VHVHAIGVERDVGVAAEFVVDGDQQQVDIGLLPDAVVREAPAEERGQDRAIVLELRQKGVERGGEFVGPRCLGQGASWARRRRNAVKAFRQTGLPSLAGDPLSSGFSLIESITSTGTGSFVSSNLIPSCRLTLANEHQSRQRVARSV
jgi:hypothetical protein